MDWKRDLSKLMTAGISFALNSQNQEWPKTQMQEISRQGSIMIPKVRLLVQAGK